MFGANSSWSLRPPGAAPAAATRESARDATRSGPAPVSEASRRFRLRLPETPAPAGVLASEEDAPTLVLAAIAGAQGAVRAAARPDISTDTARSRKPPHAPLAPPLEAEGRTNTHGAVEGIFSQPEAVLATPLDRGRVPPRDPNALKKRERYANSSLKV